MMSNQEIDLEDMKIFGETLSSMVDTIDRQKSVIYSFRAVLERHMKRLSGFDLTTLKDDLKKCGCKDENGYWKL